MGALFLFLLQFGSFLVDSSCQCRHLNTIVFVLVWNTQNMAPLSWTEIYFPKFVLHVCEFSHNIIVVCSWSQSVHIMVETCGLQNVAVLNILSSLELYLKSYFHKFNFWQMQIELVNLFKKKSIYH